MTPDRRLERVLMTADTLRGVWTYALQLIRNLPSVEFTLATMGAPLSVSQRQQAALLQNLKIRESDFALEWMNEPWDEVDRAGQWLLQIAREIAPDLIHLNGYTHATLCWNAPVLVIAHSCIVSWWHAVKVAEPPPQYDEYRRRVRAGLIAADLVIAPTRAILDSLRENY